MTKSELHQLAKEQLHTELNSYVEVKTIEKRTEPNEVILYYVSSRRQLTLYSWLSQPNFMLGEMVLMWWLSHASGEYRALVTG
jgi:hypothetical protein